jgi:Leucine-rich repeat (LRR) protein
MFNKRLITESTENKRAKVKSTNTRISAKALIDALQQKSITAEELAVLEISSLFETLTADMLAQMINSLIESNLHLAVKELKINVYNLEALPENIGLLQGLTKLDVSQNKLKAVPESVGQLVNLTSLNLSSNKLLILPANIG